MWDENAEAWTKLARAGYDISRDHVNTPAFFAMLPDVRGLRGLDVGCGEGHNTRLLAGRGARMTAVDISGTFVRHARETEAREPLGIDYLIASALDMPLSDGAFDFATAFMSLMDMPDHARVLGHVHRVLRPGGFFQLSMTHPCFQTRKWRWLRDEHGRKDAIACGDYFRDMDGDVDEWIFGAAPPEVRHGLRPFRIPRFTHTLSRWVNLLADAGFVVERMCEPTVDEAAAQARPELADHRIIAYFLQIRVRRL